MTHRHLSTREMYFKLNKSAYYYMGMKARCRRVDISINVVAGLLGSGALLSLTNTIETSPVVGSLIGLISSLLIIISRNLKLDLSMREYDDLLKKMNGYIAEFERLKSVQDKEKLWIKIMSEGQDQEIWNGIEECRAHNQTVGSLGYDPIEMLSFPAYWHISSIFFPKRGQDVVMYNQKRP